MDEINGQFPDDPTVNVISDVAPTPDSKTIADLEQHNSQLAHDNAVIEKRIIELKHSIDQANIENEKLQNEVNDSKAEVKALGSVAARASELEGEVSRLQHDLISSTSELEDVNRELTDVKSRLESLKKEEEVKMKEFEAVVAERDMLMEKVRILKVKEEEYMYVMHDKGKLSKNLWAEILEMLGDEKEIDTLKRKLVARVCQLERKLEEKDILINEFEVNQREMESVAVEGKTGGEMNGKVNLGGWPVIAGSAVCAVGLTGLVVYLRHGKRD